MSRPRTAEKPEGWHRADIVAAVKKRGTTLIAFSASLGLTRSETSRALILPHRRVNQALAAFIGVHESILWPHWYDADGRRIGKGSRSRSRSPQESHAHAAEVVPASSKHAA